MQKQPKIVGGGPETVTLPDLVTYIQDLLKLLLPEDPNHFLIDRAH